MRKVQYPPENVWQGFSSGKKRERDFYLFFKSFEQQLNKGLFSVFLSLFKT